MKNKKVDIRRFKKYLVPYIPRFIAAMLCMGLFSLMNLVSLWFIKNGIDGIFMKQEVHFFGFTFSSLDMLTLAVAAVPVIFALKGLGSYGRSYLLNYIGQNIIRTLRIELYDKLISLSHDFYVRNSSAKMMSRVTNDLGAMQNALVKVPPSLLMDGLTFIFMIGTVFYLNWKFALVTFVGFPVAAIPLIIFSRKIRRASKEGQIQMAEIYSSLHQMLNGFSVIKAFNTEEHEHNRFKNDNNKFYHIALRVIRVDARSSPIMEFMGAAAGAAILFLGGRDVINGVWSTGAFVTFLGAVFQMYQPIKNFANVNSQIQAALASSERVFEVLDEQPSIKNEIAAAPLKPFSESIVYKDVDFGYLPDKDIIKNLNLTINYGETAAFVGHSGSGKTTIANILLRFYDPRKGRVLIDGQDIKFVTLESLRSQVGIVTQDVMLFDDTVKYNIAYGSFGASDEDIIKAAKNANAHDFISKLPQGYDTPVGERGLKLSGGEKQRISIARAMLKNPPILVLDEATSALDSESEKLVQSAIDNLMKDRTVILIAHRLATVRNASKIIVMDRGEIAEAGSHAELMGRENGIYRKLNQLQGI
ncbi:MAG: ABC transporter ATP-binding protein/permease [Endomicrobium sp.]|jgi:subfamily B ATP-binding cassette protein MsbA|nr:ABC transporter ATP-binding protein/permease [Endomicrobium sp.]